MLIDQLREALPTFTDRDEADPETYPAQSMRDLYDLGVIQAPFAQSLGGAAATLPDAIALVEMLSGASGSLGLIAAMPLGLASVYAMPLDLVPGPSAGDWNNQVEEAASDYRQAKVYAACNSERGAGGSLAATKTTATRGPDGQFRLSGEKILASSGTNATRFFSSAKVKKEDLPGAGIVEFFLLPVSGEGVEVMHDWDGFGMRSSESHTVRYDNATADRMLGFPNFIELAQPLQLFALMFAAVPLGCAGAMLRELTTPPPSSPALRLKFNELLMRYESIRAYLYESAAMIQFASPPIVRARVMRTKTYVASESTKLAAELFALGGGRSYRQSGRVARLFRDTFAGTALRPPLVLGLETLSEGFAWEPD